MIYTDKLASDMHKKNAVQALGSARICRQAGDMKMFRFCMMNARASLHNARVALYVEKRDGYTLKTA